MNDVARFRHDDPPPVVASSFACPTCLHRPSMTRLSGLYEEPAVTCACLPCGHGWEVALTGMQMLRLTLSPPSELMLERSGPLHP